MSGALTPEFVYDLESNMRMIQAQEFQRLSQNSWWQRVAKRMASGAKKERISWLFDSASLQYDEEANMQFEELAMNTTEYEIKHASKGLRVARSKFEDLDGNGVQLATAWVRQQSALAAYWPQKQLAVAMLAGESTTGYDGENFFSDSHPLNPFDVGTGTYANLFTGAASGPYPGACPIDDSVSLEEAVENLGKVLAYIKGAIKMPNGEDPRMLRVGGLIVPERMSVRAQQLTNARFIAQDSKGGGGGSADVEKVVSNWGLGQPVSAPELGSAFTSGSDTTYYVLAENIMGDELGAYNYVEREPFAITYYTGRGGGTGVDAILDRVNELEWHNRGRNVIGLGHPYLIFKCKAA